MFAFIANKKKISRPTSPRQLCVYALYAFSKHEEQTLVRSERANAGEKKFRGEKKREHGRERCPTCRFSLNYTVYSFVLSVFFSFSCNGNGTRLSSVYISIV